ncbi:hypothetical protein FHS40_005240 [Streptomyces spectabilis]|uniref:Uncharacterized protein n=1 Tax=Streptomyces spectabilis TaxID=68270 RepID=A0A7W8AZ27_STRST|nr:hypothetical protein [Streptomyces spectabilis]
MSRAARGGADKSRTARGGARIGPRTTPSYETLSHPSRTEPSRTTKHTTRSVPL